MLLKEGKKYLRYGDVTEIARKNNVSPQYVHMVLNETKQSDRIEDAILEKMRSRKAEQAERNEKRNSILK